MGSLFCVAFLQPHLFQYPDSTFRACHVILGDTIPHPSLTTSRLQMFHQWLIVICPCILFHPLQCVLLIDYSIAGALSVAVHLKYCLLGLWSL